MKKIKKGVIYEEDERGGNLRRRLRRGFSLKRIGEGVIFKED